MSDTPAASAVPAAAVFDLSALQEFAAEGGQIVEGRPNKSLAISCDFTSGQPPITATPCISISMPGRAKLDTVMSALAG